MTVETTDTFVRAPGNGVATVFNFPFRVFDATDLVVRDITDALPTADPVTLTYQLDYQVVLSATEEGGTVTLTTPLASGHTLDIRSLIPLLQETSVRNQGRFQPEIHENAFDRTVRMIQDLERQIKQAFRFPDYVDTDAGITSLTPWLSKFVYIGPDGTIQPATSIGATILTQSLIDGYIQSAGQSAINAALITAGPQGVGAALYPPSPAENAALVTPVDTSAFARPWLWVRREGCLLNGTDDYTAFQKCLTVAAATNTGLIIDGPMTLGTNTTIPKNVALWFVGAGCIKPAANRTVTVNCRITAGHQQIFDISASNSAIAGRPVVDKVSVCWFGAVGDDSTNDTVAIQRCLDFCKQYRLVAFLPSATFLVTDSLLVYSGCNVEGTHRTQYNNGFSSTPYGTTIHFTPATPKDCFAFQNNGAEFLYHCSIGGIFFRGDGSINARYCIDVDGVIYGRFYEMAAGAGDWTATIRTNRTISNRFSNIYCRGTVSSIRYSGGSSTSDVWDQCSFQQSPIGVNMIGACISIRFNNCLFEQLDNYGAYIVKDCQNIMFSFCYAEDVPFTNNAAGAMFKFGHDGTTLVVENGITVMGGTYQGRNAGTVGSFFDSDYCNGAFFHGVNVSRYTNVNKATANTRNTSLAWFGGAGIGFTNFTADATTLGKVTGIMPNGVINTGSNDHLARLAALTLTGTMTASSVALSAIGTSYANDGAAAAGGVAIGQYYRNGSAVQIRIA